MMKEMTPASAQSNHSGMHFIMAVHQKSVFMDNNNTSNQLKLLTTTEALDC